MTSRLLAVAAALAIPLAACGGSHEGGAPCGIAALAGPTTLLDQFHVPRQTLSEAPRQLPPRVVARVAAGPAYAAEVGRTDSMVVVGINGTLPADFHLGFGVMVVDPSAHVRGIMLYQGDPIQDAPIIGSISADTASVPLIGIQLEPTRVEDPKCPFFPDSILR